MNNETAKAAEPIGYSDELAAFIGSLPESRGLSKTLGGLLVDRLRAYETETGSGVTPRTYMLLLEEQLAYCQGNGGVPFEDLDVGYQMVGQRFPLYEAEGWGFARRAFGETFGNAVRDIIRNAHES